MALLKERGSIQAAYHSHNLHQKHEIICKLIDRHKPFKPHRKVGSNDSQQSYQKQYHTHWAPMTIEKWAIPIFTAAGFKKTSVTATKRFEIDRACCKICSDWK